MSHPIMLPEGHVERLAYATALILPRRLPLRKNGHPDLFEIQNASTRRRNLRHCLQGHPERQESPSKFVIEIIEIASLVFRSIDAQLVRAAGYANWREMHDDWKRRRHELDVDMTVYSHTFKIVEARFLHEQIQKGYAHDPSAGAFGEPEAVSEAAVNTMAVENRARFEGGRAVEMRQRKVRNLTGRLRDASRRNDADEILRVSVELRDLAIEARTAAIET